VNARYNFSFAGLDIQFAAGGHPNGEIVVSQINLPPDSMPAANFTGFDNYWIINNYGTNQNLIIDSIWLYPYGNAISSTVQNNPALSELYFRNSENAFENQWSTACFGSSAADSSVQYAGTACGIGRSGQFWMTRDETPSAISNPIKNELQVFPNPAISGQFVYVEGLGENLRFRLFDSSAKLIRDLKFEAQVGKIAVPIPELPEGIYYYRVETESTIKSGKIHIRKN
jgi:hypothetical protein